MPSPNRIVPRVAGVDAACLLHDQSELGIVAQCGRAGSGTRRYRDRVSSSLSASYAAALSSSRTPSPAGRQR
jgi:hypothetical protein